MDSPPPAQESKRRRARDVVQRGFLQVKEVFRSSPKSRPASPSGSSIAPLAAIQSPSPAPSGSLNRLATQPSSPQGQVESTAGQIAARSTLGATVALPIITTGSVASPQPTLLARSKDANSVAWNGLEMALRVLEKSANAFPSLKSAVGGLIACLDIVRAAASNRGDYEELASELTNMSGALNEYIRELSREDYNGSVALIVRSIEAEVGCISRQQDRGKTRQLLESAQDEEDVVKRYRRVEKLFRQLQNDISLRTWRNTNKHFMMSLLKEMSPVEDARYNSGYSETIKRRGCTAETREKIQEDLQTWVQDPNAGKVYWMNGMAGTGKTTIAYSLCEWLEQNQQLGASFFCSRSLPACRDVKRIIPTIAYHLARFSPVFRSALCKVLEDDPNASALNIAWQFEKLVRKPMEEAKEAVPGGVLVVVDALDECEDSSGVRLVIETLLRLGADLPVRFFVTSRPEPAIQEKMLSPDRYSPSVLHLHDIEQSIVEADIQKYLREALSELLPPPSENEIRQLARLAGKLFIYAVTVARYILPENIPVNSNARLKAMLATGSQSISISGSSRRYKELDRLYKAILAMVFGSEGLEDEDINVIQLVLWTVVCAEEPLTTQAIASLLHFTEYQVFAALRPLRSVLHVSRDSELVSTLHASFPDFMLDPQRSDEFHCDKAHHSQLLANRCFDVMKEQLRFNICGLESSFVFDQKVPNLDERVQNAVSPALFYACRYFGEHLRRADSPASDQLGKGLVGFLSGRLLFWMEVLNIKNCIVLGVSALSQAQTWVSENQLTPGIGKQLADARNFVTRFAASACTRSTPHIYISALPFCSKNSTVYENYWGRVRGLMDVKGTMISRREEAPLATWMMSREVISVAFSLDGSRIVSGCEDNTILVWDAHTGTVVAGPFQRHIDAVWSVAFSPDGTQIVSGSRDRTIYLWDANTGAATAGPFQGHTDAVRSVAFSPDGTRVVSGSFDNTIIVWDANTGVVIAGPFQGHTSYVFSALFSPDGTRIVSGSMDNTIRVWDTHTGVVVTGPLQGHTGSVFSAVFSPDGTRILSGSADGTIRLWDAHTGIAATGQFKGHTAEVRLVAFSSDGTRIVSGSDDRTILVWDADTSVVVAGPFYGHTDAVSSVAFSPDGTRIVSGSEDRTIRVWDAYTGIIVGGPLQTHNKTISSVAFSPVGTHIVSGSQDTTILMWDAQTGVAVAQPLKGHTGSAKSVTFSPNGGRIVSGSADKTVRVWDAITGLVVAGPLHKHDSASVTVVACSPDGTRIACGYSDNTILVLDAQTGVLVAEPFNHTDLDTDSPPYYYPSIWSVAFSPDGTRIVSGSDDRAIRVWDAQTSIAVAGPFIGHTGSVTSVAFSPNGACIVSGSSDSTIRVWDARTGIVVAEPFQGHTDSVLLVKYSSDGTRIISCSKDNTIRVWDAHTGDVVAGPFHRYSGIHSVAISLDDTRIVYGSRGNTIRIYGLDAGNEPKLLAGPTEPISPIASSSTDRQPGCPGILAARRDFAPDGWITVGDELLFWVSPDLQESVPYPGESWVIGPQGSLQIDSWDLLLGDRWSECYVHE